MAKGPDRFDYYTTFGFANERLVSWRAPHGAAANRSDFILMWGDFD